MSQRKAKIEGDLGVFVKGYARKAQRHTEPNDRRYDRSIEQKVKAMRPEELSELMYGSDESE